MKPLLDLDPSDCRWPVTADKPFLFCGAPKAEGSSYCACHRRLSVSAEQPAPYGPRTADFFAGGRVRTSSIGNANAVGRRGVDVMMAQASYRPLPRDFFPKEAAGWHTSS